MSQSFFYPFTATAVPAGGATAAKQDTGNTSLGSIDTKLTSQATAAKQDTGNTSVASIDTKTPALVTGRVPVDGSGVTQPVSGTFWQATQPVSIASIPLATGAATEVTLAAFSAKTAGSLVPVAFDYQAITYNGVTTDINTVVYKTGGSGGTTVATLTMGYDGSNRLTSVTRS